MSHGLTIREASRDVPDTVAALRGALGRRGIEIFTVIDHAAGAASVGLELEPEVVVIFGNPAVGTALMQADPRAGIDLPLRMLVWRQRGVTRIAYEDPHALADRYALHAAERTLDTMGRLLETLAIEAATQ